MTALAKDRKTARFDSSQAIVPRVLAYGIGPAAVIFGGAIFAVNAAGYAVPGSADPSLRVVGVSARRYDNSTGAAGAISGECETGCWAFDNATGSDAITIADLERMAYVVDDHTLARDDGGGTRPPAGTIKGFLPNGQVCCSFSQPPLLATGSSLANFARVVATAIDAYAGTGTGVLTKSTNGALAAQDGATIAVGDEIFLPPGLANVAAKDSGPWVAAALGQTSVSKWRLERPSWWRTGDGIRQAHVIQIGGEGTAHRGMMLKALCGKGLVIDTDDPVFYPASQLFRVTLAAGTYTIGAGGGSELLWLLDTTKSNVHATLVTPGGTLGTDKIGAPSASRVAGYPGTAAIVVNSYNDNSTVSGETSTVDVESRNW